MQVDIQPLVHSPNWSAYEKTFSAKGGSEELNNNIVNEQMEVDIQLPVRSDKSIPNWSAYDKSFSTKSTSFESFRLD